MRLFQAALDTCLDSPPLCQLLSSRFALHGFARLRGDFSWPALVSLCCRCSSEVLEEASPKLSSRSICKEGKSAINLSDLGKFCQIWPQAIYLC